MNSFANDAESTAEALGEFSRPTRAHVTGLGDVSIASVAKLALVDSRAVRSSERATARVQRGDIIAARRWLGVRTSGNDRGKNQNESEHESILSIHLVDGTHGSLDAMSWSAS